MKVKYYIAKVNCFIFIKLLGCVKKYSSNATKEEIDRMVNEVFINSLKKI